MYIEKRYRMNAGSFVSSWYVSGSSCEQPSRHEFYWFSRVFKKILRWFLIRTPLLRVAHLSLIHQNKTPLHRRHSKLLLFLNYLFGHKTSVD